MLEVQVLSYNPGTDMYEISFPNGEETNQWAKAVTSMPDNDGHALSYLNGLAVKVVRPLSTDQWYIIGVFKRDSDLAEGIIAYANGDKVYWAGDNHCIKTSATGDIGIYATTVGSTGKINYLPVMEFDADEGSFKVIADKIQLQQAGGAPRGEFVMKEGLNGSRLAMREFKLNNRDLQPRVRELISNPLLPFLESANSTELQDASTLLGRATYELSASTSIMPIALGGVRPNLSTENASFLLGYINRDKLMGFNLLSGNTLPPIPGANSPIEPVSEIWGGIKLGSPYTFGAEAGIAAGLKGSYRIKLDGSLELSSAGQTSLVEMASVGTIKAESALGVTLRSTSNFIQPLEGMARGESIHALLTQILTWLQTHTHLDPVSGTTGPPATLATLLAEKAKLLAPSTMVYSLQNKNN